MNIYELGIIESNDDTITENKESFNVYHCEDCDQSYEMSGNTIFYHTDFPTFGVERKSCCNCS